MAAPSPSTDTPSAESTGKSSAVTATRGNDLTARLNELAAQEARQREAGEQHQTWLRRAEAECDQVRYYGERTGTAGSDRGLAEQIARYLAAVRASGWGWRFEALQPNENPVWTFALVIHQLCDQGDLDGATARLAEAEALGPTWARVGVIDALMRKIPDAIGTPRAQPEDASAPCGQGEPIPAVWKALIEAVRREGLVLSLLQNAPAAGTDWNAGILRLLELWRRELPDLAPPEIPRARTYQEVQAAVDVFLRAIEAAARTPSAVPLPVVGVVQAASGPAKVEQP